MFDFDKLDADAGCIKPGKVIYTVRAIVDTAPEVLAEAVAAALLQGEPCRVDEAAHAKLFVSPPVYAEEYLKEFKAPPRVSHLLADEVAHVHAAAFPMGFRPLRPGETSTADGDAFHVVVRRLWLHSTPELAEACRALHGTEAEASICSTELEGDHGCRVFVVRVRSPTVRWTAGFARGVGWLSVGRHADDDLIVYRCSVGAHGVGQAELKQELMETNIFCVKEINREALTHVSEVHLRGPERVMKMACFMLEEEARLWTAAKGFGLVEIWRGVRSRACDNVLAIARFVSTVYNCTPGEGGAAACESAAGVRFNMLYAKKLAARFRRKRYDGVHGGAPGVSELEGGQFTDGSVSIRGFALALDRVCRRALPEADIFRRFVDLGSGRGNAVIAAHALFPFRACTGVEILAEHVEFSRRHALKYRDEDDFYMSASRDVDLNAMFVQGDFLTDVDWADASVVFCNAVTWPRRLIRDVALLALRLQPGAVFMLLGFGKFFPTEPEVLDGFDFRSDACLVSWVDEPQGIWVYQRR